MTRTRTRGCSTGEADVHLMRTLQEDAVLLQKRFGPWIGRR